MTYTFFINIGAGYVQYYPEHDKCSFIKSRDKYIFAQLIFDGSLVFKGAEYTILRTRLNTANYALINIYADAVLLYSGKLSLLGKYNQLTKVCELSLNSTDNNPILLDNIDKQFDVSTNNYNNTLKHIGIQVYDTSYAKLSMMYGFVKFKDMLEYYVNKAMEPTAIVFNAASYAYMDTKIVSDFIYISSFVNTLNNNENVVDDKIMFNGQNSRVDYKVSVKQLIYFIESTMNMGWEIYTTLGVNYFRFKHKSELNYSSGSNPNLTTLYSNNWSHDKNGFEYATETRYNIIERSVLGSNLDHLGKNILIPSLDFLGTVKKSISLLNYSTDVSDICVYNPEKYRSFVDSQFCVVYSDIVNDWYQYAFGVRNYLSYDEFTSYYNAVPVADGGTNEVRYSLIGAALTFIVPQTFFGSPSVFGFDIKNSVSNIPINTTIKCSFYITLNNAGFGAVDIAFHEFGTDFYHVVPITAFSLDVNVLTPQLVTFDYVTSNETNINHIALVFTTYSNPNTFTITTGGTGKYAQIGAPTVANDAMILQAGASAWNQQLSLASLDDKFMGAKLSDTPAIINNVSTAVTVEKKFKSNTLLFPCDDINAINFNELITTDLGDVEATSFKVNLNGSAAELNSKI
jgi:hypothetical protein